MRRGTLPTIGLCLIVAVVYFAGAELGLSLASLHENVTPVWPPTGIAIAAVLIFGPRVLPGVFLGALAANLPTSLPISLPTSVAEHRPDILASEATLHVASAKLGVAMSELLPPIHPYLSVLPMKWWAST